MTGLMEPEEAEGWRSWRASDMVGGWDEVPGGGDTLFGADEQ